MTDYLALANDICHEPFRTALRHATRDASADLADRLIAQERRQEAADIARAGTAPAFLEAAYELEIAAVNLRAFARGMVSDEQAEEEITRGHHALDRMAAMLKP